MTRFSIEQRTGKYVKGYGFSSFARKYKKQLLDAGLEASKKEVHKTGEYLGNKIADVVTKSNEDNKNLLKKYLFYQKKELKY